MAGSLETAQRQDDGKCGAAKEAKIAETCLTAASLRSEAPMALLARRVARSQKRVEKMVAREACCICKGVIPTM